LILIIFGSFYKRKFKTKIMISILLTLPKFYK